MATNTLNESLNAQIQITASTATKLLLLRNAKRTIAEEAEELIQQTYGQEWSDNSWHLAATPASTLFNDANNSRNKLHFGKGSSQGGLPSTFDDWLGAPDERMHIKEVDWPQQQSSEELASNTPLKWAYGSESHGHNSTAKDCSSLLHETMCESGTMSADFSPTTSSICHRAGMLISSICNQLVTDCEITAATSQQYESSRNDSSAVLAGLQSLRASDAEDHEKEMSTFSHDQTDKLDKRHDWVGTRAQHTSDLDTSLRSIMKSVEGIGDASESYPSRADRKLLHCPHCPAVGSTYATRSHFNLRRHIARHHSGGERPLSCVECGQRFKDGDTLKTHMAFLHRDPSFSSPSSNTRGHVVEGGGWKSYECTECGKSFTQSSDLLRHVRIVHRGERRHQCGVCGRSFQTATNLKRHSRSGKCSLSCDPIHSILLP